MREEEALLLALSSRRFSPWSAGSTTLSLVYHNDDKGCPLHGSQEAERITGKG